MKYYIGKRRVKKSVKLRRISRGLLTKIDFIMDLERHKAKLLKMLLAPGKGTIFLNFDSGSTLEIIDDCAEWNLEKYNKFKGIK